jgi:hypothetical protein
VEGQASLCLQLPPAGHSVSEKKRPDGHDGKCLSPLCWTAEYSLMMLRVSERDNTFMCETNKLTNPLKFRALWDVTPCSRIEVYRRFRGAYCLHHQVDESVRISETSVNFNETTRRYIPED